MSALALFDEVAPLLSKIEGIGTSTSILVSIPTRGVGIHFADPFDAKRVARALGGLSSSYYDCEDGFTTYEGAVWVGDDNSGEPISLCLYGPRDSVRAGRLAGKAERHG